MRKIYRLFFLLALLLTLAAGSMGAVQAEAKIYPSLVDEAGILQESQRQTVLSSLQSVEKRYGVRVAVVTVSGIQMKAWQFADRVLEEMYTDGVNGNMVLVLDMKERDWFVATDSKMRRLISDNDVELLGKRFVPYLSQGNYAGGFRVYAAAVNTKLRVQLQVKGGTSAAAQDAVPRQADSAGGSTAVRGIQQEGGGLQTELLGFAAVAAMIIAYGVGSGLRKSMSNVSFNAGADQYLAQDSFELQHSEDTYLYTSVKVIPRPKSSGTRGGFGRGGHGGAGGKF